MIFPPIFIDEAVAKGGSCFLYEFITLIVEDGESCYNQM